MNEDLEKRLYDCNEKIKKCNKLHEQYTELSKEYTKMKKLYEEQMEEVEIIKSKYEANKNEIEKIRKGITCPEVFPKTPKTKRKNVSIKISPKIYEIEKIGTVKVPPVKSWQKFLQEHRGQNKSMKELSNEFHSLKV